MTRVRAGRPGDARAISHIYVESWRDAYAGILPDHVLLRMSEQAEQASWRRMLARGELVLVAESGRGTVVAFGSWGASRIKGLGYSGEVYTLYVLPGRQGQGIGRRLLAGLFEALGAAGHKSAVIWVLADNPPRFFYEALGGRRVAERNERIWGVILPQAAYGWRGLRLRPAGAR